ncbi:hypothetical protein N7466_006967 [Penicillium verhagenii]|uniref:uncharacterized protein n=1 Tax=Penicillium verhagenii TaxID=1562060 RepID=UPI0025459CFF|nr:uncharacterized protein N7466_006967 [Penicillium verhagenii]KAJ5928011.1 hypothetical protein N7466_006967 [Penicillium verhagenii]
MESRSRNRRLVTYGSTTNNQSQSKTAHSHASTTKHTPTISYHSRRPSHHLLSGLPKEKQPQGSHEASDDKIYDLPSSSEEDQQYKQRRKRRRCGSEGNTAISQKQETVGSRKPAVVKTDIDLGGISTNKPTSATLQIKTVSPRNKKDIADDQSRLDQVGDSGSQKPNPRVVTSAECLDMARWSDTFAGETELPKNAETQQRIPQNAQHNPSPLESLSYTTTTAGNGVAGRRRLIDSLGTRERSSGGSSSDIPADSQLSSSLPAPPTPTRQQDLAQSSTPIEIQSDSHGQDPTVAPSPHLRGSKVTYARQRSFLDDLILDDGPTGMNLAAGVEQNDPLGDIDRPNPSVGPRPRLFTIAEPSNDDGTVRSIHELRQAGGNARYRGAIEAIFEDIEDNHISTSGRCNAFVQLCSKLLDTNLARQFLECNFDKRLVDLLSKDLDLTSSSLALCAYDLCAIGRPLPYILASAAWPKLLDISLPLLDVQDDLLAMARAPPQKISKATQLSIQHILPQLKSRLLLDIDAAKLSPCFLALQCLRTTIVAVQEKGENPTGPSVPFLRRLVNLMLSTNSYLRKSSNNTSALNSQALILGLSILEAHTTSGGPLQRDHRDVLVSIASLYSLLSVGSEDPVNTTSQSIRNLYIRVILNVTNSHPGLCDDFATPEMIGELAAIAITKFADLAQEPFVQDNNNSLDTVILALGALINLTEQSETSRVIFLNPEISDRPLLDQLLDLFSVHFDSTSEAHSVPEVHHNVAVGYLAVLLLALCLNPSARIQVTNSLNSKGLLVVLSTVEEFLQYHRKIEQELQPLPVQGDSKGFHTRLQDLMIQIQHTAHV